MRSAAFSLAVGLVLADSSVAVLALPAIYRELEVDLGDLHWVLTTSNLVLALVRLRPRAALAQSLARNSPLTSKVRRLQQFSQRCTLVPKLRAQVRFLPGASSPRDLVRRHTLTGAGFAACRCARIGPRCWNGPPSATTKDCRLVVAQRTNR